MTDTTTTTRAIIDAPHTVISRIAIFFSIGIGSLIGFILVILLIRWIIRSRAHEKALTKLKAWWSDEKKKPATPNPDAGGGHGGGSHAHPEKATPEQRANAFARGCFWLLVMIIGFDVYWTLYHPEYKKEGELKAQQKERQYVSQTQRIDSVDKTIDLSKDGPIVLNLDNDDFDFYFSIDENDSMRLDKVWYHGEKTEIRLNDGKPHQMEFRACQGASPMFRYKKKRMVRW